MTKNPNITVKTSHQIVEDKAVIARMIKKIQDHGHLIYLKPQFPGLKNETLQH